MYKVQVTCPNPSRKSVFTVYNVVKESVACKTANVILHYLRHDNTGTYDHKNKVWRKPNLYLPCYKIEQG